MNRISAWSYIVEPGDLWQRRIDRRYYYQAPRIASEAGEQMFLCPAAASIQVPVDSVAWQDEPLASPDTWARRDALVAAGIDAEMFFPTYAWSLFGIGDPGLRLACLKVYNNWQYDLSIPLPRVHGVPLIMAGAAGAGEIERSALMQRKAVVVGVGNTVDTGMILDAAAAHNLPVVLVRPGGSTPVSDFAGFAADVEGLADDYGNHEEVKLLTLANGRAVRAPGQGDAWGLFGDRANLGGDDDFAFIRGNAIALYSLAP